MTKIILTSSFCAVAQELYKQGALPNSTQRVAFIPTAGDVYENKPWMEADRKALFDLGYAITDIDLKAKNAAQLKEQLGLFDIIFVGGGNTTYLFEHAHASGFDVIIRDVLADGRIYIGSSAGSILAGPTVEPFIEDELPELPENFVLKNPEGLRLVDYVILPHYPRYAEANDEIAEKFFQRWKFVKMTNSEYRIES